MPNLRISFRNLADAATVTANPALLTTLPEANLQRQERYRTSRTTSLASQEYKFAWTSAQTINMIAMRLHNLTAAAQLAAPTYSDSAFTTAIDTNAAANCFAYTGLDANDVLTEADFRLLKNSARYLTSRSTVQSLKATVTDAANPDGYFDISRFWIGKYHEFAYQAPMGGVPLTFDDFGTQERAHDGSLISDKGAKARRIDLSHDFMPAADWAALLAGLRLVGKDKELWVSVFPENGTYLEPYYHGIFKVSDGGQFDLHKYGLAQTRITLIES